MSEYLVLRELMVITLFSHLQLSSTHNLNLSKTKMIRFLMRTQSQVNYLTFSILDKNISWRHFSQKTSFDLSCKSSPMEIICIKCQTLFSGKKN